MLQSSGPCGASPKYTGADAEKGDDTNHWNERLQERRLLFAES